VKQELAIKRYLLPFILQFKSVRISKYTNINSQLWVIKFELRDIDSQLQEKKFEIKSHNCRFNFYSMPETSFHIMAPIYPKWKGLSIMPTLLCCHFCARWGSNYPLTEAYVLIAAFVFMSKLAFAGPLMVLQIQLRLRNCGFFFCSNSSPNVVSVTVSKLMICRSVAERLASVMMW